MPSALKKRQIISSALCTCLPSLLAKSALTSASPCIVSSQSAKNRRVAEGTLINNGVKVCLFVADRLTQFPISRYRRSRGHFVSLHSSLLFDPLLRKIANRTWPSLIVNLLQILLFWDKHVTSFYSFLQRAFPFDRTHLIVNVLTTSGKWR